MSQPTDPMSAAYAAYEQFEAKLSTAMDQLVATNGFAELFTTTATTMMAVTKMANDAIDQVVRSTRLAARQDVTSLARQLARTEDKIELLLQSVEAIEDRLAATESRTTSSSANSTVAAAAEPATAVTEPVKRTGTRATVKRATVKRAAVKPEAADRAPAKRATAERAPAKRAAAKRPAAKRARSGDGL
ncbi:MAG: hypothetical protein JNL54_12615 [Kineosporiaceae bacterium]|nr:hypothetical protein [Kineosporiaceae bacterium]